MSSDVSAGWVSTIAVLPVSLPARSATVPAGEPPRSTSAVGVSASVTGLRRPSSVKPTGKTVAVATFMVSLVGLAAVIDPLSESVTALPGGAANRTRVALFRYG